MNAIKILDASLRDGGHRTNFHFNDDQLKHILTPLDKGNLDYIEIGYRNGAIRPIDNIGRAGICAKDYLQYCNSLIKNTKIAVMAHPENIALKDLRELKDCGITLLRLCIAKNGLDKALPHIENAKNLNLEVSVNFIHLSYYLEDELDQVVKQVNQYQPHIIYFADSNGSMFPEKISQIYQKYTQKYQTTFGFHAHDNLGLAQANTLAALTAGAQFIDASLAGMGKGIGNLKTEFFIAYLHALHLKKHSLGDILTAANYVREKLQIGHEAVEMDEFVRGISDLSTADLQLFNQKNKS